MRPRVQVFSLTRPPKRAAGDKRRHRLKWRVDGRDFSRSFKSKAEGDRFRSQLLVAIDDGSRFDPAVGLPLSWIRSDATWWTWSREWLVLKWPRWAGKTRRTSVETLTALTQHLVRPGAPAPPDSLGRWLRSSGYRPDEALAPSEESQWLDRWSVPLEDLGPGVLESALTAATTKHDGKVMATTVIRRRRNALKTVLTAAVRRGLIPTNPMDRMEWDMPQHSLEVDVSTVPSVSDVDGIVDEVASLDSDGRRYATFFAVIGLAGLRPSEVAALAMTDVELPESGWGSARLRGAITSPGPRFTADGQPLEHKGLKHRPREATREVPLSPDLVVRMLRHIEQYPPVGKQIFANASGRPVSVANYSPAWRTARAHLWPDGHSLSRTTVYDLRHTAATTMLRSGVMPSEVARRLGHSVDVLMRVYAGVFQDERDRSNVLIEAELAAQRANTAGGVPPLGATR